MSFVAAAIGGGALIGAGASVYGASQQSQANQQAQQTIQQNLAQQIAQIQAFTGQGAGAIKSNTATGAGDISSYIQKAFGTLSPYAGAGSAAMPTLMQLLTPGPNQTAALEQTPGFQFAEDWGMRGINNAASTSGFGGNVAKAGADYSENLAKNTWQNVVNSLMGVVNTGASAASGQSGALQAGGLGLGSLFGGAGSSLASLFSGAGGAVSGATGTAGGQLAGLQGGQGNILAGAAGGVGSSLSGITNAVLLKNLLAGNSNTAPPAQNVYEGNINTPANPSFS